MLKFLYNYSLEWPAWKFGVLKVSMLAFGILIGCYFPTFWRPLHVILWATFGVTAVVTAYWGFQAMAQSAKQQRRPQLIHPGDGHS